MKCSKCGNEIQNNAKFCNICGEKVKNKENNKKLIIVISAILLILFITLVIKLNSGEEESKINYKVIETNYETAALDYIRENEYYDLDYTKDNYVVVKDLEEYYKDSDIERKEAALKCRGYVELSESTGSSPNTKAYISCGEQFNADYETIGFDELKKYTSSINSNDNTSNNSENNSNESSSGNIITIENTSILNKINEQLSDGDDYRLYYLFGAACVNENDLSNDDFCKNNTINKNKDYFTDTIDRIRYTSMYISANSENISGTIRSEYRYVEVSREVFNKYMKKLFGVELTDSDFNNQAYKDIIGLNQNGYIECWDYDGMGMHTYLFAAPKSPTYENGVYTLQVDLVKTDVDAQEMKEKSYDSSRILGTMYLKYRNDNTIISLSFKK